MVEDAGATLVVTDDEHAAAVRRSGVVACLALEKPPWTELAREPEHPSSPPSAALVVDHLPLVSMDDIAYIL